MNLLGWSSGNRFSPVISTGAQRSGEITLLSELKRDSSTPFGMTNRRKMADQTVRADTKPTGGVR
ncbi:MAG: hypothetical protein ABIK54_05205 [candidate division WOR-3 bacterium]